MGYLDDLYLNTAQAPWIPSSLGTAQALWVFDPEYSETVEPISGNTFTDSSGTFYVELGIDGTQTGSPGTRGGSNTGPYTDVDEIADGGSAVGDHATGGEVKIWARPVQKAVFSSTVVTELQTALGLS